MINLIDEGIDVEDLTTDLFVEEFDKSGTKALNYRKPVNTMTVPFVSLKEAIWIGGM